MGAVSAPGQRSPQGFDERTARVPFPADGLRFDNLVLRLPGSRVAAYVEVGNIPSERVLERSGFAREGVVRSLPKSEGRSVDKTLFSLLPGE